MKIQIRRSIFETNSSSVHSITMVSGSDYDKWKNGEFLYDKLNKKLVTKEEIEKIKESDKKNHEDYMKKHNLNYDFDESEYDYNKEDGYIRFLTYDKFFDWNYNEYDTFTDYYTTNGGEEVVAFGFYGHD